MSDYSFWYDALLDNKYRQWHDAIIERAKNRELPDGRKSERHHIVPRSMCGGNEKSNIVVLTVREHLDVHELLVKFTVGKAKQKMVAALILLTFGTCKRRNKKITSRQRREAREAALGAKWMLGKKHSLETKSKMSASHSSRRSKPGYVDPLKGRVGPNKGRKFSNEVKAKLSVAFKGRPSPRRGCKLSEETKTKISANNGRGLLGRTGSSHPRYGKKHTEEFKAARRAYRHSEEVKKKIAEASKVYRHSEEVKKKIAEASKVYWAKRRGIQLGRV